MWPPESSKVEYQMLGECLSCGRGLTGVGPRVPVANPADLGDLEIVVLWRFWTQSHYAVSGMAPEPWSMDEFCLWLKSGSIESPEAIEMKTWEHQLVADFRRTYAHPPPI